MIPPLWRSLWSVLLLRERIIRDSLGVWGEEAIVSLTKAERNAQSIAFPDLFLWTMGSLWKPWTYHLPSVHGFFSLESLTETTIYNTWFRESNWQASCPNERVSGTRRYRTCPGNPVISIGSPFGRMLLVQAIQPEADDVRIRPSGTTAQPYSIVRTVVSLRNDWLYCCCLLLSGGLKLERVLGAKDLPSCKIQLPRGTHHAHDFPNHAMWSIWAWKHACCRCPVCSLGPGANKIRS